MLSQVSSNSLSASLDDALRLVININNLKPIPAKNFEITDKYILGQALFYDPILSGNRDVSCSTCHLVEYGMSDGLTLSIGTGGIGKGPSRSLGTSRELHQKNSLDLFNRDHNDVLYMFWDGRIDAKKNEAGQFITPLLSDLPNDLENLMAVQAMFPLITHDEMLGYKGDLSSPELPTDHQDKPNEIVGVLDMNGIAFVNSQNIYAEIMKRLLGNDDKIEYQNEYAKLFEKAFPNKKAFSIADVGNALSHFMEIAFASRDSLWDRYLKGDLQSLTVNQKNGALIFYGKGRCAVCHSGETFSDYQFHSVGVRDTDTAIFNDERDTGRYAVTGNDLDLYKFRTPPLRNSTKSSPYFHNGTSSSLLDVIEQHNEPARYLHQYHESGKYLINAEQISRISPILRSGLNLSEQEINYLVDFLFALENINEEGFLEKIVPENVPSGLSFFH